MRRDWGEGRGCALEVQVPLLPEVQTVTCLKNSGMEAPDYMYKTPSYFFFVTYEDCCTSSFDFEYRDCLRNSKSAEVVELTPDDRLDPDGNGDGGGRKDPEIQIEFKGKPTLATCS